MESWFYKLSLEEGRKKGRYTPALVRPKLETADFFEDMPIPDDPPGNRILGRTVYLL